MSNSSPSYSQSSEVHVSSSSEEHASPSSEEHVSPEKQKAHKIIDEGDDNYRPGGFHPVYIGDVYNNRYKILNKIGYGVYSTVWVVKDLQSQTGGRREFLALKVLRADCYGIDHDIFEREILKHLRDADQGGDRKVYGYNHITHLVDDFEHDGPNGTHVCLVFELYGETLRSFGAPFDGCMIPTCLMRSIMFQLLCALDFAHEHGVIHTDIQPSNIFVKFRDHSLIESQYLKEAPAPHQDRDEKHYKAIPSRPFCGYYCSDPENVLDFEFVLGDWGVASWTDKHLTNLIQPVALRAPEGLIGAPWDKSTDIWNLGAVLLELYRAVRMFDGRARWNDPYQLRYHLAEIVNFFGPFPKSLLEKGNPEIVQDMFDEEGRVKGMPFYDRPPLDSEWFLPDLTQEKKESFLEFFRSMMKIDPDERPSAEDLTFTPWVGITLKPRD
ncbi:serine/threonine protein kinase [Xylaria digitata]|nr:serine/threonine protein kinase [Xylaria digitata]